MTRQGDDPLPESLDPDDYPPEVYVALRQMATDWDSHPAWCGAWEGESCDCGAVE